MELISISPARIEVEHMNGYIGVFVDPTQILGTDGAADMVAELIRNLGAEHGTEQWIWGGCVRDALAHAQLPTGHKFMFPVEIGLPVAA